MAVRSIKRIAIFFGKISGYVVITFEMVQAYFEKIGMDTSFHSVYEESKLLTDYFEKQSQEIVRVC